MFVIVVVVVAVVVPHIVFPGMREGVTDTSLHALAAAGCGSRLTKLHLSSEWLCEFSVVV